MMNNKNFLCLDLGTTMGWAIINTHKLLYSGTIDFRNSRFQGGGMRFLRFRNWLDELENIKVVYFEEVRKHLGVDAAHVYGGFLATLTAWCEDQIIPYEGIHYSHIKKHVTGSGSASKQQIIEAVEKKENIKVKDDNEADAIALSILIRDRFKKNNYYEMGE